MRVKPPDSEPIELTAESSEHAAGRYEATFVPRTAGAYRAEVVVRGPDDAEVGRRETGWSVEPDGEEFQSLGVNRELLDRMAQDSEGEVVEADELDDFVSSLPNRKLPIVESWTYPLWNRWPVLAFAMACLVGEWGVRRWRGLP